MRYSSPAIADFVEIRSLNVAFLGILKNKPMLLADTSPLATELAEKLGELTDSALQQLAQSPFLLFSLRESDDLFWEQLHQGAQSGSLFQAPLASDPACLRLTSAALGFVWQMARQNPYTLRLTCCGNLHWAEQIAEQALISLINRAASADILRLRAGSDARIWRRLLLTTEEPDAAVRSALLNSVLQSLLVTHGARHRRPLKSAACRVDVPSVSLKRSE